MTEKGPMVWLWYRGIQDTAPHGTWLLSTRWLLLMWHKVRFRPERQRRSLQRGSLPSTAVCHPAIFLFRWLSSLLADDAHRFIIEIGRRMTFSTEDPRSCTNASQWRFNATMPCVLQTLLFPIPRSHSGHYHHLHHQRRTSVNCVCGAGCGRGNRTPGWHFLHGCQNVCVSLGSRRVSSVATRPRDFKFGR